MHRPSSKNNGEKSGSGQDEQARPKTSTGLRGINEGTQNTASTKMQTLDERTQMPSVNSKQSQARPKFDKNDHLRT